MVNPEMTDPYGKLDDALIAEAIEKLPPGGDLKCVPSDIAEAMLLIWAAEQLDVPTRQEFIAELRQLCDRYGA